MRSSPLAAVLAALLAAPALAQTPSEPVPGCALSGSPNVLIEGGAMLRLGDVTACPGLRYEIIPGVFVNGQPAVRLLPSEDCATDGADSVAIGGGQAQRQGDVACSGG